MVDLWKHLKVKQIREYYRFEKQEVGDDLSVCVLNLKYIKPISSFIRNVFL